VSRELTAEETNQTLTRGEFQRAKNEVLQVHTGAKLVMEEEVPPPRSADHHNGYFARFAYAENYAGGVRPLESLLYVYSHVGQRWTLKYRVTYPASSLEARAVVNQFIQELRWTIPPATNVAAPKVRHRTQP
jgi:hypothetical protein